MSRRAIGIVAGRRFEASARVLLRSIRAHHPDLAVFVLATRDVDLGSPSSPLAERVDFETLAKAAGSWLAFRYAENELAVALKAFLLDHLLDSGYEQVLHLDADILVVGNLESLFERLGRHSILLAPHSLSPLVGPEGEARELVLLRAGVYNGGVLGVTRHPAARQFLEWWKSRLREDCRISSAEALHDDQRWLDLVPGAFDGVGVCRDPGVNLAYWNFRERGLARENGVWSTSYGPASLVHFSGFDPRTPGIVTRHQPRLTPGELGVEAILFREYASSLLAEGWSAEPATPYRFDRFDNGVSIPDIARRVFHELGGETSRFGDPFRTDRATSFFAWLRDPMDPSASPAAAPARLWMEIWRRREDLRRAFPEPLARDRGAFLAWVRTSGAAEHGIDRAFEVRA